MADRQGNRLRVFLKRKDPLILYSESELIKRFHLNSAGIRFLHSIIGDILEPTTERNRSVPAIMEICVGLRYLATGKMQLCNGDDFGLSQPTISRIISQFLNAITAPCIVKRFIKFPTTDAEVRRNQIGFHGIAGFPGVVGVIDGTQIRIVAPSEHEADYVNRKNFHSINVQIVFDHTHKVIDLVTKWPGSTHDARILRQSGLYACFESKSVNRNPHLLGDSGYPAKQWLLTPYLHPQAGQQSNYNNAHKRTRCVVERGIGQLKRRFHVLHGEIRLKFVRLL